MDLMRCTKGHFYDGEKYDECPHCKEMENSMKSLTFGGDDDSLFCMTGTGEQSNGEQPTYGLFSDGFSVKKVKTENKDVQVKHVTQNENITTSTPPSEKPGDYSKEEIFAREADEGKTIGFYGKNEPVVGWLVCISGEHYGEDFKLKCGMNFVGRLPSMDVPLIKDKGVSREKHITIIYDPKAKKFTAYMGESKELVYVNDVMLLSPVELKPYDKIAIGKSVLMIIPFCGEKFDWSYN